MREDLNALFERCDVQEIMREARTASADPTYPAKQAEKVYAYAACLLAESQKWSDVLIWAERGLALRQQTELTPWLHHLYGVGQLHFGDLFRAIKHLRKFRRLAKDLPQLERWLDKNGIALAQAYRFMGDHNREVTNFDLAARYLERKGLYGPAADCNAEIAWSYLIRDQVGRAETYLCRLPSARAPRPTPYLARALYHVLVGEQVKAAALCSDLLGRFSLTHEQKVDVLWVLAMMHWHAGDSDMARCFAQAARQFACNPWSPLQMTRVESLLSRMGLIHAPAGDSSTTC